MSELIKVWEDDYELAQRTLLAQGAITDLLRQYLNALWQIQNLKEELETLRKLLVEAKP